MIKLYISFFVCIYLINCKLQVKISLKTTFKNSKNFVNCEQRKENLLKKHYCKTEGIKNNEEDKICIDYS